MKSIRMHALIALASMLMVCGNAPAGSLYAVKQAGEHAVVLVRIDTESLEAQEVGPLSLPIRPDTYLIDGGMAWDPHSQTLYYALHSMLMTIDLNTLVVSNWDLVEISLLTGLAYDCANAELYGVGFGGGFYAIDPTNGAHEPIPYPPGNDQDFTGLAYNQAQDILVGLKGQEGDLYLLEWRTGGDVSLLYDNPQTGKDTHSLAYDIDQNLYWSVNLDGELYSYDPADDFQLTLRQTGLGYLRSLAYVHDHPCKPPPTSIPINYGLTDAWFNPATTGQGFFITVFPETRQMFLAWFTYDTERPPESLSAIMGEPGHRWMTAFGPYEDHTALLDIEITSGGVLDSMEPVPTQRLDGGITLHFEDCNSGIVSYDIPSIGRQGEIPIERIVLDKVALCEELELAAQPE
jgi:hypothetical protein